MAAPESTAVEVVYALRDRQRVIQVRLAQGMTAIQAVEAPAQPTAYKAVLLPADWPGRAARKLCGEIYRGVLPASEQWLDRNATNPAGALPAAGNGRTERRTPEHEPGGASA